MNMPKGNTVSSYIFLIPLPFCSEDTQIMEYKSSLEGKPQNRHKICGTSSVMSVSNSLIIQIRI